MERRVTSSSCHSGFFLRLLGLYVTVLLEMAGVHILSILNVIIKEQLSPLSELVRIFLAAIQMCHGEVRQIES